MKKQTFRRPRPASEVRKDKERQRQAEKQEGQAQEGPVLVPDLAANIAYLEGRIGQNNDVVFREFVVRLPKPVQAMIVFVDGLVSGDTINEYILQTLTTFEGTDADWALDRRNLAENFKDHVLTINEVSLQTEWAPIITAILSGESAIFLEGEHRL